MPSKRTASQPRTILDQPEDDLIVDVPLLAYVARRRAKRAILPGLIIFAALFVGILFFMPQKFSAVTSIVIQQPQAAAGSLGGLLGSTATDNRYIGIIKSRTAAEEVESQVNLQKIYRLPKYSDAITMLMKAVKPEDVAADSMLYVTVTLPAAPRFHPGDGPSAKVVKQTTADAANAYADALRHYYETDNTDRESVLLRVADNETQSAQARYDQAIAAVIGFADLHDVNPREASISGVDPSNPGPAELSSLYTGLYQVQEQIRQAQIEQQSRLSGRSEQLSRISSLPAEDPLLTDARKKVVGDQSILGAATAIYGPDNPHVVTAKTQLSLDEAELAREVSGVRSDLSTEQLQDKARLQGLTALQDEIQSQIEDAESRLRVGHRNAGEYARLEQQVTFAAAILTSVSQEAATVRMQNVSSASHMQVIDTAIPPIKADIGLLIPAAIALLIVVLWLISGIVREYYRRAARGRPMPRPVYSRNGVGSHSEHDTYDAAPTP